MARHRQVGTKRRRVCFLTVEEALRRADRLVRKYAANSPYRLPDDDVVLRNLVRGLAENWARHGLPYCPCKQISHDREQDRGLVCPCEDHHDEIRRDGACCCGLYVKGAR